ncbi:MAG: hypothetical protein JWQ27_423 [Ferruginibacter sp.]|nr:hypothetical protein [Ferruginibacter sp.]
MKKILFSISGLALSLAVMAQNPVNPATGPAPVSNPTLNGTNSNSNNSNSGVNPNGNPATIVAGTNGNNTNFITPENNNLTPGTVLLSSGNTYTGSNINPNTIAKPNPKTATATVPVVVPAFRPSPADSNNIKTGARTTLNPSATITPTRRPATTPAPARKPVKKRN